MNQNERLLDASIGHAVDIQTYGTTLVRRVIALLNRVDPDLVAQVVRARESLPEDSFTVQRLDALLASVRRLNSQSYQQAYGLVERELEELADLEVTWQTAQIAQAPGVAMAAVDSEQVAAAALSRPFQGRLLREWMSGLEAEKAATIRDAIRIGYIEGQTTDQIVRRIRGTKSAGYADGLLEINRKNAQSIVLTAVNHTSNFAANAVYEANADVVKAVKYSAVLDTRTTPVCRGRDGNLYPLGAKRPSLPAHIRCRSNYVPVLKSFREMGIDADDFTATQRASMDGQVPGDLTYNDWLKRQSAARQDEVLGVTKAKLFRTGELTLDRFIARDGAELTLAQLRQKYPDVFKKADL